MDKKIEDGEEMEEGFIPDKFDQDNDCDSQANVKFKSGVESFDPAKEDYNEKEQVKEIKYIKNSEEWQSFERRRQTLLQEKQELEELNDSNERFIEEALPALEAASKAVSSSFSKNDLNEIKTFSKPPKIIVKVFQALMILLGLPTDWDKIKKFTSDKNCINVIKELNYENIPKEQIEKLSDFIDENNLTDINSIKLSSLAASHLASYLVNFRQYWRVDVLVRPKIDRLKEVKLNIAQKIKEIEKNWGSSKWNDLQRYWWKQQRY